MPDFTFLVIANKPTNRTARRGKISAVQEGDGVWGRKEVPPRFHKIPFSGTEEEAQFVLRNCDYDFANSRFCDSWSRLRFKTDDIEAERQVRENENPIEEEDLAELIIGDREPSELWSNYGEMKRVRKRILQDLCPEIAAKATVPSVVALLHAVRWGNASAIRKAFRSLTVSRRMVILRDLKPQTKRWLRWICEPGNKGEADSILAE